MSYTPFIPVPLLFRGNSSSVTGTLVETTLASVVLKAGMVGPNDYIEAFTSWSYTNVARNKTLSLKIGSSSYLAMVTSNTLTLVRHVEIHMRGALNSQVTYPTTVASDNSTSTTAIATFTEDLSVDKTLALTGTLSNTADTINLEACMVILWKNPVQ